MRNIHLFFILKVVIYLSYTPKVFVCWNSTWKITHLGSNIFQLLLCILNICKGFVHTRIEVAVTTHTALQGRGLRIYCNLLKSAFAFHFMKISPWFFHLRVVISSDGVGWIEIVTFFSYWRLFLVIDNNRGNCLSV